MIINKYIVLGSPFGETYTKDFIPLFCILYSFFHFCVVIIMNLIWDKNFMCTKFPSGLIVLVLFFSSSFMFEYRMSKRQKGQQRASTFARGSLSS